MIAQEEQPIQNWWWEGYIGSTWFVTMHPINAAKQVHYVGTLSDLYRMVAGVSSLHAGGANFCFADGSVRFLSESIDSWDLDEAEVNQLVNSNVVTKEPSLFQWLSTRGGREALPDTF